MTLSYLKKLKEDKSTLTDEELDKIIDAAIRYYDLKETLKVIKKVKSNKLKFTIKKTALKTEIKLLEKILAEMEL